MLLYVNYTIFSFWKIELIKKISVFFKYGDLHRISYCSLSPFCRAIKLPRKALYIKGFRLLLFVANRSLYHKGSPVNTQSLEISTFFATVFLYARSIKGAIKHTWVFINYIFADRFFLQSTTAFHDIYLRFRQLCVTFVSFIT